LGNTDSVRTRNSTNTSDTGDQYEGSDISTGSQTPEGVTSSSSDVADRNFTNDSDSEIGTGTSGSDSDKDV
jgi:hypothetical protein